MRCAIVSACGVACLCALSVVRADDARIKPNFLVILADDVGCETLGCYQGQSYQTPRLDQLAKSGMRFDHCYSMPVCHPTRICLLLGRYPLRVGNPKWGSFPRDEESRTFAHPLKRAGYATAVAGKWQLTLLGRDLEHPHRLGFDEYCLFGWHEGARYYDPLIWQNGKRLPGTDGKYGPDVYTDFLVDFMRRNREQPFLAFYSMALCHDVTDDLKEPVPHGPRGRYDNYQEMIEAMDARVGRLVDALEQLGLREKTLILFTTDNGTPKRYIHSAVDGKLVRKPVSSKWRGRDVPGGKGNLTDDGTHVPLIANWPGAVAPGTSAVDLVDSSDFFATLLDLSGASSNVNIDGHSFAPRLLGKSAATRRWAFSQGRGKHWVRTQRWKLYSDKRLFDVAADPGEQRNLAPADDSKPAAAARMLLGQALRSLETRQD